MVDKYNTNESNDILIYKAKPKSLFEVKTRFFHSRKDDK